MNEGSWTVFGLALLPALDNFGGGLLAEWSRPSQRSLNRGEFRVVAARDD